MDILRAEKIAKDRMFRAKGGEWDNHFVIIGSTGVLACEWVDPYFGLFKPIGKDGIFMTKDIPGNLDVVMSDDIKDDGQPDESKEWQDYDPEC